MADALDEFKQMPKLPSLSDKEKTRESNQENEADKERFEWNTEAANESFMDWFNMDKFNEEDRDEKLKEARILENLDTQLVNWEITEEEYNEALNKLEINKKNTDTELEGNINEEQEKENNLILDKFKDNPVFPVLERFMNIEIWQWKTMDLLTESDLIRLSDNLWDWDNELTILRDSIDKIEFDDNRTQTVLDNYLYTVDNINEPIIVDWEWMYSLPDDFKWESNKSLIENIDHDVVQLIIKNYKKFPDWEDGNPNIEKDIFTSCEVTLNKIIENKNFPHTTMYEKAVHDIRNWDIDVRVEALKYVNSLVNTWEWIKWAKNKSSFHNIKNIHNLNKESYIEFKVNQLNEQIIQTKDIKEKNKLELEKNKLELEMNNEDNFEWEVISGWKYDVLNEKNPWESNEDI